MVKQVFSVKLLLSFLLFFFAGGSSFARFRHFAPVSVYGSPYLAVSSSLGTYFKNIDSDAFPVTFSADAAWISEYFDAQAGFEVQNRKFSLSSNFQGQYEFPFRFTLGGTAVLNYSNFFSYAQEVDMAGAVFASYRTSNPDWWWGFDGYFGFGSKGSFVHHSGSKWLPAEWNLIMISDLSVQTFFLKHHLVYFDVRSFEDYCYSYNLNPNFAFGYNYIMDEKWVFSADLEFYYSSFLTTSGLISRARLCLGATYRIPFGGRK